MINILLIVIIVIGLISMFISRKLIYKKRYMVKNIAYTFFYTAVFLFLSQYLSIESIKKNLDTFVSISATLAGFVFTGLSIVLALIDYDYIKDLFKNDFIDVLFITGYSSTLLSILNIGLYVVIKQYSLYNSCILMLNQYILGVSLLLLISMILDFIFLIRQLKVNLNRGK